MDNLIKKIIKKKIIFYRKYKKNEPTGNLPEIIYRNISCDRLITHVSAFTYGNAGDTLLPIALRDLWHQGKEAIAWQSQPVYPEVTQELVNKFNQTSGIIIGGGGLFLKDTNANEISGWQWPCSVEMLHKIKVPVVLFAVGYNRFRGQEDFAPVFTENLRAFAQQAEYIGLRNYGSIRAIQQYVPDNLHYKLRYQPCMTTFLAKLYPSLCNYQQKEDFVAFNAAFDRSHLRFGDNIGKILDAMARTAKAISAHYPIKFYSHMPSDEAFLPFLQSHGVPHEIVRLNSVHPGEIVKAYARPRLVIGMRGHAQMIPFGCNTPLVSVVSHNKMQWFLDDIQQPAWGADVLSATFEQDLLNRSWQALSNFDSEMKYIARKQEELHKISLQNVQDALCVMTNK